MSAGDERTEPAPEGDYAFTVGRARQGRQHHRGAAARRRPRAWRGPGTGVDGEQLHAARARCRPSPPARWPTSRSVRWTATSTSRCRGSATRSRCSTAAGWRAGSASTSRRRCAPACTWCACARGGQRAVWPLAVAGLPPRSARGEARPLVVLPALTWQGLNRVDDDADGFADRLPFSRSVGVDRPSGGGTLPRRFDAEVSPLLRWLDRERLPYDLTTDLALARHEGPALGNAPGVAFAGSELWLPDELLQAAARLRRRRRPAGLVRRRIVPAGGHAEGSRDERPDAATARGRARRAHEDWSGRARRR